KPRQAPAQLQRIAWETGVGMGMSNMVAFFIMLTTAATLHANGHTDIQSTEQAAEALKPIAGNAAFILFSIAVDLSPLDPIKALVWSAVINGVAVVPILVAMMIVASRPGQMGKFIASPLQRLF